jgi:acid phosphatase
MKKLLLIIIPLFFIGCSSSPDLINMDTAKAAVQNYYENGQYDAEMDEIIDDTIDKLSRMNFTDKSLAIFDIDETILSNYPHTQALGFGFNLKLWNEWLLQADAPVIPQTKKLYDWLIDKGVNVVFITGRQYEIRDATIKNLNEQGITQYVDVITRSPKTSKMSAAVYKNYERSVLADKGYDIVLTIGDQWSDLEGENTGLKVKLPNYLYLID